MQKNDSLKILEKHIKAGDTVIAAISGGPDSVFLLDLCLKLRKRHPFKIIVAHVNHRLRGRASDLDEQFVRQFAAKNNLACKVKILDEIGKGNLEEVARNFRYEFFEQIRKKHHASWILTAHHRDDNIETVLFNLARGSSLNGIKGMRTCTEARHLLRPLLKISKTEILKSLHRKKIKYRLDSSNCDNRFSRNLLRNKIIPLLRRINGNFGSNLLELIGDLDEVAEFMERKTGEWLRQNTTKNGIPLDKFLRLPPVLQKTVLAGLYRKTHGSTRKFNKKHLSQLLLALNRRKSGIKKEFGDRNFLTISKPAGSKERLIKILSTH